MDTGVRKSLAGRLTVEIGHGCSLKPSAAGSNLHFETAASAGSSRAAQVPSQAWPVAFGSAVLNASVLVAKRLVKRRIGAGVWSTYLSLCHVLQCISTRPTAFSLRGEYVPKQRKPA